MFPESDGFSWLPVFLWKGVQDRLGISVLGISEPPVLERGNFK